LTGTEGTAAGPSVWNEAAARSLEERLVGMRTKLEIAQTLDDFQDVGRRARQILIDLGNLVFDASMLKVGVQVPGANDAKARLDAFFEHERPGSANADLRRMMRAAFTLANTVTHAGASAEHAFAVAEATMLVVRVVAKIRGSDADWFGLSTGEAAAMERQTEASRARRGEILGLIRAELARVAGQMADRQERSFPPMNRLTGSMWRPLSVELAPLIEVDLFGKIASAYELLEAEIALEDRWLVARAAGGGVAQIQGRFFAEQLKLHDRDLWRLACDACRAIDAAVVADGGSRGSEVFCPF
jgi:hypothetical protein